MKVIGEGAIGIGRDDHLKAWLMSLPCGFLCTDLGGSAHRRHVTCTRGPACVFEGPVVGGPVAERVDHEDARA